MSNMFEVAQQYRASIGKTTGVVVVCDGEIAGWMDRLRDPQHWVPQCVAVDADGATYTAVGGDAQSGARKWRPT